MHSILDTPTFTTQLKDMAEPQKLTLPEVFEHLREENVSSFTKLTKMQESAWHFFLAQLGALMHLKGEEATVREGLLSLTDGDDTPWHLIVPDRKIPAFMQPPETLSADNLYKDGKTETLDEIAVVSRAKHHELKQGKSKESAPEVFAYTLIESQTSDGFMGRGNYGISRMYSGTGARCMVTTTPSLDPGAWHNRDVEMLLASIDELSQYTDKEGHALLWTLPWDGAKDEALDPSTVHPLMIEVCRRYRLTESWSILKQTTKSKRIFTDKDDAAYYGLLSPIWSPVKLNNPPHVFNPGQNPFSYSKIGNVLWGTGGTYKPSPSFTFKDGSAARTIVCRALNRGQGKSEGYYERYIDAPAKAKNFFDFGAATDKIREESRTRVEEAGVIAVKLRHALSILFNDPPPSFTARYDAEVDQRFFDRIWDVDATLGDREELRVFWQDLLKGIAKDIFSEAEDVASASGARKWRLTIKARRIFHSGLNKAFGS